MLLFHHQIFTAPRPSGGMTPRQIHRPLFLAPSALSPSSVVSGSKMKSGLPNLKRLPCQKRGEPTSNGIRRAYSASVVETSHLKSSSRFPLWSWAASGRLATCFRSKLECGPHNRRTAGPRWAKRGSGRLSALKMNHRHWTARVVASLCTIFSRLSASKADGLCPEATQRHAQ